MVGALVRTQTPTNMQQHVLHARLCIHTMLKMHVRSSEHLYCTGFRDWGLRSEGYDQRQHPAGLRCFVQRRLWQGHDSTCGQLTCVCVVSVLAATRQCLLYMVIGCYTTVVCCALLFVKRNAGNQTLVKRHHEQTDGDCEQTQLVRHDKYTLSRCVARTCQCTCAGEKGVLLRHPLQGWPSEGTPRARHRDSDRGA